MNRVELFRRQFPNLTDFELYENTSDLYNCISHSIGMKVWAWPKEGGHRNYWPISNMNEDKKSFDEFYAYHGYNICNMDFRYNPNYSKIALYGKDNNPKHAAKQIDEIWWESKIGQSEIIRHKLFDLEGFKYGDVIEIYQKIN